MSVDAFNIPPRPEKEDHRLATAVGAFIGFTMPLCMNTIRRRPLAYGPWQHVSFALAGGYLVKKMYEWEQHIIDLQATQYKLIAMQSDVDDAAYEDFRRDYHVLREKQLDEHREYVTAHPPAQAHSH